ncbi:MAG: hypothetical protein HZY77_03775 [Thiobacillus sp.]|nr:MAG: hypothetical protein HZY77_03775 [Thiobacillus sp.]
MDRELAIKASLMAVWRRQPSQPVIIHSAGSQFSHGWQASLKFLNLVLLWSYEVSHRCVKWVTSRLQP